VRCTGHTAGMPAARLTIRGPAAIPGDGKCGARTARPLPVVIIRRDRHLGKRLSCFKWLSKLGPRRRRAGRPVGPHRIVFRQPRHGRRPFRLPPAERPLAGGKTIAARGRQGQSFARKSPPAVSVPARSVTFSSAISQASGTRTAAARGSTPATGQADRAGEFHSSRPSGTQNAGASRNRSMAR
jgi:hypothetical protein